MVGQVTNISVPIILYSLIDLFWRQSWGNKLSYSKLPRSIVALKPLVLLFEEKVLKIENFPFSFGYLNGNRNRDKGLYPPPSPAIYNPLC